MKLLRIKSPTEWGLAIGYQSSNRQHEATRVHVLFLRVGPWLFNAVIA